MSCSATASAGAVAPGFRPAGPSLGDYAPTPSTTREQIQERAAETVENVKESAADMRTAAEAEHDFLQENSDEIVEFHEERAEAALESNMLGRAFVAYQPQAIVSAAISIMALLMIGVVVLGKIDNFTPSLSGTWQNTSDNVSEQSASTFDFLNLVPFIIVALFVLGLMVSRM